MIPGPKPKPAEISEKQGNPGHRAAASTPDAVAIDAAAPSFLTDVGVEIWTAYIPKLRTMGFVKDTDRMAFARLCDHMARWLDLRAKVALKGESYTTESRHGKMDRINPDFAAMLRVEEKLVQLEDRFGLTPAARQQIAARMVEPPAPPSDMFGASGSQQQPARAPSSPLGMFAPTPPHAMEGKPN